MSENTDISEATQGRALAALAPEIAAEHGAAQDAARSAVEHAIRCGELLTEAKAQVRHGEWGDWLGENFPASERTARGYMRLAAKRQRVADMEAPTIRAALAELAEPREFEAHWALDLIPPMTAQERAGLRDSIREHGCLVPVERDEDGVVLDGRERLRACREFGIKPPTITRRGFSDGEKVVHVLALNLLRGHLAIE